VGATGGLFPIAFIQTPKLGSVRKWIEQHFL
jgi:hypothetical protein